MTSETPNDPCISCKHQHERSGYKGTQLVFSPCKVWNTEVEKSDRGKKIRQVLCQCKDRI